MTTSTTTPIDTKNLVPADGKGAYITVNGQNYNAPIQAQSTAPTNAAQVNYVGSPAVPTQSPYYGNTAPAVAATDGTQKSVETQIQEQKDLAAQAQADATRVAQYNQTNKSLLSSTLSEDTIGNARTAAQSQTGLNPTQYFGDQQSRITEIGSLQKDYNTTKAQMDAAIQAARDNAGGALQSGVDANITRIQQFYAPQLAEKSADINAKAAVLQALQGNWESAQKFVNQAVDDATSVQKNRVDLLKSFIDQNNTEINRLDSKYQNAINLSYKIAQDKYTQDRNAANDYYDNKLKEAQLNKLNREGGSSAQSNFNDVMQAAIDQGATPEQAARAAASVSEGSGIQVDQTTLNNWTNQARNLKKAPAQAPTSGPGSFINNQQPTAPEDNRGAFDKLGEAGKYVFPSIGEYGGKFGAAMINYLFGSK